MPRLLRAFGVIVWALLKVLLTRRRPQPLRLPPTGSDPVADALAGAHPVPRFADAELNVEDLRRIVTVEDMEVDEDGYNTAVGLDDTVSSYADVAADGLEDALTDQPGIDAVEHRDREFVAVRSVLSLPDVHAATIRALLAINRTPRRTPRLRPLRPAAMSALADGVATLLAGHGFAGRLRMASEDDGPHTDPNGRRGPGFYRVLAGDGLVQVVRLRDGVGYHRDDGTIVDPRVMVTVEVVEVTAADLVESIRFEHGWEVVAGERVLSTLFGLTPATVDSIAHVFVSEALPLCESTRSRAAIVDRWVSGLPWFVPDGLPWEAADVAARWGFREHARDLLRYGRRGAPQSVAVAAKYGL